MSNGNDIRKAFRTTKIKASSFGAKAKEELELLFLTLEASKTDAVAAERAAAIATAKAGAKRANAGVAELELLKAASESSNQIAGERYWIVYKDKEGEIIFEGITERLLRNNLRAQQENIARNEESNTDDADRNGLYESGEDDEEQPS